MKKMIALILAYVSLLFFTLMRFGKNAVEAYLSVQLIINNHPVSSAVVVRTRVCETVLIVLAVICLVIAIVETLREKKKLADFNSQNLEFEQHLRKEENL